MPHSDSDTPEAALITPDAMARILEPRVRSNAKNNAKVAKSTPPKIVLPVEVVEVIDTDTEPKLGPIVAIPKKEALKTDVSKPETTTKAASTAGNSPAVNAYIARHLAELRQLVEGIQENQSSRDRAFDLLYEELNGYKNDFYLERLKPTLRSLLFLLDSIEGFDREIDEYNERGTELTAELVKANLLHFRDQLTDILTLSEMTPIEAESDQFDPKTQRAVEVVAVEPAQNNTVQRQIRGGWRLSGKMLRPADVIVGRSNAEGKNKAS